MKLTQSEVYAAFSDKWLVLLDRTICTASCTKGGFKYAVFSPYEIKPWFIYPIGMGCLGWYENSNSVVEQNNSEAVLSLRLLVKGGPRPLPCQLLHGLIPVRTIQSSST